MAHVSLEMIEEVVGPVHRYDCLEPLQKQKVKVYHQRELCKSRN